MERHKPFVYKRYGYWWVAWKKRPHVWWTNTCFDTAYNEAQRFANKVSALA